MDNTILFFKNGTCSVYVRVPRPVDREGTISVIVSKLPPRAQPGGLRGLKPPGCHLLLSV